MQNDIENNAGTQEESLIFTKATPLSEVRQDSLDRQRDKRSGRDPTISPDASHHVLGHLPCQSVM